MQEIACLRSRDCGDMQNSDGWPKVKSSYGRDREKQSVESEGSVLAWRLLEEKYINRKSIDTGR